MGEHVNHGRFYPNMDELAELGLIEKHRRVPDDRTNTYAMTNAGTELLKRRERWLAGRISEPATVVAD
jgi:DNA-binding PadR family transcriptional regulator